MNWPVPGNKGAPSAPQQRVPGGPDGPVDKGRTALPPPCPRCDVTKAQFNRTIQNYQKAYRKKVEGLKTELKSTRNTNESLRKQVKQLKSPIRVHVPSLVVGLAAGVLWKAYAGVLRRWFQSRQKATDSETTIIEQAPAAATVQQPESVLAESVLAEAAT